MKRFFTLLILIPSLVFIVSCSKDDKVVEDEIIDTNNENEEEETPENEDDEEEEDVMIIDGTHTFDANQLWDLADLNETTNLKLENGLISLVEDARGVYQSKAIEAKRFEELVISFNTRDLTDGSISFLVSIGNEESFSDFFIMGSWLDNKYRSGLRQEDDFARVSIDTLTNKDPNNNLIKLKVVINPGINTKLKNISVTTAKENDEIKYDESKMINKVITVPRINQLSIPVIGNSICSPTSVSMIVNYYGFNYKADEMAGLVYDHYSRIYGNWTFNASYAGSLEGLVGRVEYITDFDIVIDYIKNDIPLAFSITTSGMVDSKGVTASYPVGHLVVLIGFEEINGVWYGVFNDPATSEDSNVERRYSMDQVFEAWKLYTYVIKEG